MKNTKKLCGLQSSAETPERLCIRAAEEPAISAVAAETAKKDLQGSTPSSSRRRFLLRSNRVSVCLGADVPRRVGSFKLFWKWFHLQLPSDNKAF